jgi:hypothetical protein
MHGNAVVALCVSVDMADLEVECFAPLSSRTGVFNLRKGGVCCSGETASLPDGAAAAIVRYFRLSLR